MTSTSPADDAPPALNPDLDPAPFAETFQRTGRVHITNLMTEASAQRLHHALERETPWGLIFNEGETAHEYAAVSVEDHQEWAIAAWERAHSSFQYFYFYYRLLENRRVYPAQEHYLRRVVAFLTSPAFFDLARAITGDHSIGWISATATLYKPLDFLTVHDDGLTSRRIAYVLNMTPAWKPDWGGILQFYGADGHIEQGYVPAFNALNLFRVPSRHSVTQVASFGGLRYAISGWLEPRGGAEKTAA